MLMYNVIFKCTNYSFAEKDTCKEKIKMKLPSQMLFQCFLTNIKIHYQHRIRQQKFFLYQCAFMLGKLIATHIAHITLKYHVCTVATGPCSAYFCFKR